ncbi:MAG: ABC transporter permease [Planctomycetota bacterium]|nr:MAG: ABC transporter permease [Planctomycetota bacterium]
MTLARQQPATDRPAPLRPRPAPHPLAEPVRQLGRALLQIVRNAGSDLLMLWRSLLWSRALWFKRHEVLRQCWVAGIGSLGVVAFVGCFTGMILSLAAGIELAKFGQQDVVGSLVAISMAREMGPFMTALILTANVGSSMAAEIGTMKVSEEIEALEVMSIDIHRFLVMPRLLAMMAVTPLLTVVANLLGNLGGAVVGYYQLGVTFSRYYHNAIDILDLKAIYTGLFKALVFGVIIAVVGCGKGLRTSGGALGVGEATRTSVIVCFLYIMVFGYVITALFYGGQLGGG